MSRPRLKSDHGPQDRTRAEGNGLEIEKREGKKKSMIYNGMCEGEGFNSGKSNEELGICK